jgi:hypothetical protein
MQIQSQSKLKLKNMKVFNNFENKKRRKSAITTKSRYKKKNNKKESTQSVPNGYIIFNDYELNSLTYREALTFDKRNFFQYYISLLKVKHPIIFSFLPIKDYNLMIIKVCLFFLFFSIYYVANTLFFNESTIHQIYIDNGVYNYEHFLPQIIYSFIIGYIISTPIKYFFLSERNIILLKKEQTVNSARNLVSKVKRDIIIKYIIFFVTSDIFLLFFWYYLACFCAVYKNTQSHLILDTLISILLSFLYPFVFSLLPAIIRIQALNSKKGDKECFYKISKFLQIIF